MIQVSPYLHFNGRCREAMEFYQHCLGGELVLQKLGESPMAAQMPSSTADRILYSHLFNNGFILIASDTMGEMPEAGNSVALCLNCNNEAEIFSYFEKLSKGGQIKLNLHQTFRGTTYGELIDKFGMNWTLNFTRKNK